MPCQRCNSPRILDISGKSSDCNSFSFANGPDHQDYVPHDLNVGGGDYIRITICLDCGQHQGKFPVPQHDLETASL